MANATSQRGRPEIGSFRAGARAVGVSTRSICPASGSTATALRMVPAIRRVSRPSPHPTSRTRAPAQGGVAQEHSHFHSLRISSKAPHRSHLFAQISMFRLPYIGSRSTLWLSAGLPMLHAIRLVARMPDRTVRRPGVNSADALQRRVSILPRLRGRRVLLSEQAAASEIPWLSRTSLCDASHAAVVTRLMVCSGQPGTLLPSPSRGVKHVLDSVYMGKG